MSKTLAEQGINIYCDYIQEQYVEGAESRYYTAMERMLQSQNQTWEAYYKSLRERHESRVTSENATC